MVNAASEIKTAPPTSNALVALWINVMRNYPPAIPSLDESVPLQQQFNAAACKHPHSYGAPVVIGDCMQFSSFGYDWDGVAHFIAIEFRLEVPCTPFSNCEGRVATEVTEPFS